MTNNQECQECLKLKEENDKLRQLLKDALILVLEHGLWNAPYN